MNNALAAFALVTFFAAGALAQHKGITFQAVVKRPDGTYPTVSNLTVKLQILDPVTNCVLREEEHAGVEIKAGYLNLVVGGPLATTPAGHNPTPVLTLPQALNNAVARAGLTCVDEDDVAVATGQTYTPQGTHGRKMRLRTKIFNDDIVADFNMRAVPYAIEAEALGGKTSAEYLQVNSGANVTQSKLEEFFANLTSVTGGAIRWDGANFVSYDPSATVGLSQGGTGLTTSGAASQVLGMNAAGTDLEYKTMTASTGASVTHGAGSITIGVNDELAGLSALSANGFVKRTGAGAYATSASLALSSEVAGVLPVANGGTGLSSTSASSVLLTDGAGAPGWSPLSNDSFAQYALLAGRAGGQVLHGGTAAGDDLTLDSTANGSKGDVRINPSGGNVGVGTASPHSSLQVAGSVAATLATKTTSYALTQADFAVTGDATGGAITFTLPSAVGIAGRQYMLKKIDASANAVTVATSGGQTIDGAATVILPSRYQFVNVISDGANWSVFGINSSANSIPSGTVMTFDLAACPTGWSAYAAAQDRVVVGSGASYALGATGGAASATSSSSGSHSHTGTTGAHALSLAQIPAHNHGVNDPGHAHGVWDPGHNHGVNDPGHGHTLGDDDCCNYSAPGYGGADWRGGPNSTIWTNANVTGIWLSAAATGIGIVAATTGVSTQNNGGGGSHSHTISADGAHTHTVDTRQPYVALLHCRKN